MALIDHVWFAALTRHLDDAGTDNLINLTVNVAGTDVIDTDVGWRTRSGQGYFLINNDFTPFDSAGLTDSSVRIGIRGDDAWAPEHILIFGHSTRLFFPVAMETDIDARLSADAEEGHLTMPLRLVAPGDSTTVIRRLLLLVDTASTDDSAGTDSPVQLQITAAGSNVFTQQIPDTTQDDLDNWSANWYFLDGQAPFTRGDVIGNGGITLSILGTDAWQPRHLVLFGLDTPSGRPNKMVSLVIHARLLRCVFQLYSLPAGGTPVNKRSHSETLMALIRTSNALFPVSHPRILQNFAWRRTTLVECVHKVH